MKISKIQEFSIHLIEKINHTQLNIFLTLTFTMRTHANENYYTYLSLSCLPV